MSDNKLLNKIKTSYRKPAASMEGVEDRKDIIVNDLLEKGYTYEEALVMMANMDVETGGTFNPKELQGSGENMSEEEWFKKTRAGRGTGLIQWDDRRMEQTRADGSKQIGLKEFAEKKGVPWYDLQAQLDFLDYELKGPEKRNWKKVLKGKSVQDKIKLFSSEVERAGKPHIERRLEAGEVLSEELGPYRLPDKLPKNTPKTYMDKIRDRIKNES